MRQLISPLSAVLLLCILPHAAKANTPELSKAEAWADGASNAIHFIENKGQILQTDGSAAPYVRFALERGDARIFLLESGIAWQFNRMHYPEGYQELMDEDTDDLERHEKLEQLRKDVRLETYRMDMTLVGANAHAQVTTEGRSDDYTNYYNHNALDVHHYRKVTYHDVYPGIDWVVYTTEKGMKYDFVVHPGGDKDLIRLEYTHQEELYVDEQGGLVLGNRLGRFTEARPISYQNGMEVATRFDLKGSTLTFDIGHSGTEGALIIDPDLIWATYYGGDQLDEAYSCSTDASGNVYLAGTTLSNLAIASGGHQDFLYSASDAFIVKFDANGVRQWGTYYGGENWDLGHACVTDGAGNVYLVGETDSDTAIAVAGFQSVHGGADDAFLAKFNTDGVRQWATYYGGFANDRGFTCTTDGEGNVFMAGNTGSPTTIASGGHQNTLGGADHDDAFLVKFSSAGIRQWATYYGGNDTDGATSCAANAAGEIYLAGYATSMSAIADGGHQNGFGGGERDGFLAKFNGNGVRQWASYYGGEDFDYGEGCVIDGSGNAYLSGFTSSTAGIAFNGHQNVGGGGRDGFLAKFDPSGVRQWATYYGGDNDDRGYSCATDASGHVYLAGETASTSAIAVNGLQNDLAGNQDAFLAKFDPAGARIWATYYGSGSLENGYSCAVATGGHVYLAGATTSGAGIASGGHQNEYGGSRDGFLAKLEGGTVGMPEVAPQLLIVRPNPTNASVFVARAGGSSAAGASARTMSSS